MSTATSKQASEAPLHALVLEDDPESGEAIRISLELKGAQVTLCANGATGLAQFSPELFDVAVVDIRLGDISGVEVLRRMKQICPEFPVILMTAYPTIETALASLALNADNYILKPMERIEELLRPMITAARNRRMLLKAYAYQRELAQAKFRLHNVLSSLEDLLFVFDAEGRFILHHAPRHAKLYSKPDDFLGKRFTEVMPPDNCALLADALARNRNGHAAEYEYELIVNGRTEHWHAKVSPMFEDDRYVGSVAVVRDISERKAMENRLRELAFTIEVAEEKERGRFAADLHDSIGVLLSMSQSEMNLITSGLKDVNPRIAASIRRLADMISKASEQSRKLTFDLYPPSLREIGLEVAFQDLCDQIRQDRGVRVEFLVSGNNVLTDETVKALLFRSVRELLHNSLKHAHVGHIRLAMTHQDGHTHVVVQNDGMGFDAAAAIKGEGNKRCFGLFSVRERISRLGGEFTIESTPGVQGATFRIHLPSIRKEDM